MGEGDGEEGWSWGDRERKGAYSSKKLTPISCVPVSSVPVLPSLFPPSPLPLSPFPPFSVSSILCFLCF